MRYLNLFQYLGRDRVGPRLILFLVIYFLWTIIYVIPKSNGVDASVSAGIIFDFFLLLIVILPSYLLRRVFLRSGGNLRETLLGAAIEIVFIGCIVFGLDQLIGPFLVSRTYWQYPVIFLVVVILIHSFFCADLKVLAKKRGTGSI